MASKETNIGELDRRIIIESFTTTRAANGGVIESWSTFATVWAKKEFFNTPTMDNEKFEANRNTATSKVQYTIRYLSGVTKKMRVNDSSEYFDITAINKPGRKRWMLLEAESKE